MTSIPKPQLGFRDGSVIKDPPSNAGDSGSMPASGRSPGGGNGNPRQYSYLENPTDRGAWLQSMGLKESDRTAHALS